MKQVRPYLWGFWAMAIIALLMVVLLGYYFYSQYLLVSRSIANKTRAIPWMFVLILVIALIESFIYWLLRYRIDKRIWVQAHVWCIAVPIVIIPAVIIFFLPLFKNLYGPDQMRDVYLFHRYLLWILLTVGHVFFIATIVRYFRHRKDRSTDDPSAGLLDEFLN